MRGWEAGGDYAIGGAVGVRGTDSCGRAEFFPSKLMGSSAQNSSGVHWCRCRVRFNEVPEKVPQVPGAETGQVQQGSGKGSRRRFQEALVQSQVRFNVFRRRFWRRPGRLWCRAVSEKVPEKVWEGLVQRQVRFNRVPEKVPEKVWEALEQAEVFPALGFAARFRNICQNKALWLLGIPPELIFCQTQLKETLRSCNSMCVYIYLYIYFNIMLVL